MTPNAPGWWWGRARGSVDPDVYDVYLDRGRLMAAHVPVTDPLFRWLGPVAPPGSIPPDVYARDVRRAWEVFCRPLYADRGRGASDADVAEHWAGCVTRERLIATLTTHGVPLPEAERLADGAQEAKP